MRRASCLLVAFSIGLGAVGTARAGELDLAIGRALFERAWVPAPSSTLRNDGLGPLHNARSCLACHVGLDRMPVAEADGPVAAPNLVLRLSDGQGRPDPVYGAQVQTAGTASVAPEGDVIRSTNRVRFDAPVYGPPAATTRIGARLAPSLRGLGALEGVPEAVILTVAAEQERAGDGISGRPNWVVAPDGSRRLGRFGLKASAATLEEQTAIAFALDLGLSTPARPRPEGDCTAVQSECLTAPHGGSVEGEPEIGHQLVRLVARFLAAVPPPAPVRSEPEGGRLFEVVGCAVCHKPALLGSQGVVRAYTDLLLHDLGPALDGGATEPGVAPTEWRTAPLWGLSRTLARGAGLLHDGRARSVTEAVEFHSGEATSSRARFEALSPADRARLLTFVESL